MQDWSIPLVVAAGAFLAVVLWRVRPAMGRRGGEKERAALREAHARVEAARDDHERAAALCDAADRTRGRGAKALYMRALRADPASAEIVDRAVAGLARRPRALEDVLWRHLAQARWSESRAATSRALQALAALYEGPIKNRVRAQALARAREANDRP